MPEEKDLIILSDDLTGACDVAASFASPEIPISVYMDSLPQGNTEQLFVLNTQTRRLTQWKGRKKMKKISAAFKDKRIIFFKIDSSLRGPVGALIEGILRSVGKRSIVLMPAKPAIGKTVKDGMLFEKDRQIHSASDRSDPLLPPGDSSIHSIIGTTTNIEIPVYNAESDAEIEELVNRTINSDRVLYAGSLGIADALAKKIGTKRENKNQGTFYGPSKYGKSPGFQASGGKVLVISGSNYEKTLLQLSNAATHFQKRIMRVFPSGNNSVIEHLDYNTPLLLLHAVLQEQTNLGFDKLIKRTAFTLARIIENYQPQGIGIIGGETAYSIFCQIGVTRLAVFGRLSEVMPAGEMRDGILKGVPFVTKGGSVGDDNNIIKMVRYLQQVKSGKKVGSLI
jgi:D-threonate/D-erythronate kinase